MNLTANIMTTLSARLLLLALALVSSVILARGLGPEGRGLFALVLLIPDLARSLALLGFDQANAVYAGLDPKMRSALAWQSTALAVFVGGGIACAGGAFLALGAPGFSTILQGPLWLYLLPLLALPAALAVEYWHAILRGMNWIVMHNIVDVGTRVAGVLVLGVLIARGHLDVASAVSTNVVLTILTALLLIVLLRWVGAWGRPILDGSVWRRSARFALPAYGGNMAAYLTYRADEFIIAALLAPDQLGYYVLAVGLVERLWILPGAVSAALLPHLTNSEARDPALPAKIARHVLLWVGAASLLLFVVADWVVELLYSPAFAPAAAPLRWLLPGIFALSIAKVVLAEIIAREKIHYPSLASGVAVLLNIGLNLLLVPYMGISGAALASSVSYALLAVMWIWYYTRETRVPWSTLVPSSSDLLVYTALWRRFAPRLS